MCMHTLVNVAMYCFIFDIVNVVVVIAVHHSASGQVHISAFYQIKFITLPFIASQSCAIKTLYNNNNKIIDWLSFYFPLALTGLAPINSIHSRNMDRQRSISILLYWFNCVKQ